MTKIPFSIEWSLILSSSCHHALSRVAPAPTQFGRHLLGLAMPPRPPSSVIPAPLPCDSVINVREAPSPGLTTHAALAPSRYCEQLQAVAPDSCLDGS